MINLVATDAAGNANASLTLVNENNRPTPLLVGLVLLELTLDCLVGYAAYRFFRNSAI